MIDHKDEGVTFRDIINDAKLKELLGYGPMGYAMAIKSLKENYFSYCGRLCGSKKEGDCHTRSQ